MNGSKQKNDNKAKNFKVCLSLPKPLTMNESNWTTQLGLKKVWKQNVPSQISPFAATVDPQYDPLYLHSIKHLSL